MKPFLSIVCCLVFIGCSAPTENRKSDSPDAPDTSKPTFEKLTQPAPKANRVPLVANAVITSKTVYYVGGPQQSRPPEGEFTAGTKVTIAKMNGHYLLVTDKKGLTAWVSADSVTREPTPRTKNETNKK